MHELIKRLSNYDTAGLTAQADVAFRHCGHDKDFMIGANAIDVLNRFVAAGITGATVLDVFRIPRTAVRGADQVLIVDDENRLEIRRVSIARTDNQYAYINGGVSAGERITTTAIEAPTNGMSVRTAESISAEGASEKKIASRDEEG